MVTDEEIGELRKDIEEQKDSIDPNVEGHLQEMGFLWDAVQHKLSEDNICYGCKKELTKEEQRHVLVANKVEKGVIAFVSICNECKEENVNKGEKNGG